MSFVQERERRPNAGSRMRALLDQEVDMEELFEYRDSDEEDEEFSTKVVEEEEEDKVDSDFDLDSSEGEQEHIDEGQALDKELDKAEKRARRAATYNPPPSAATSSKSTATKIGKAPIEKRKRRSRITELYHEENGERSTRFSSRKNTVLNRLHVEDQLREHEKRRALLPKRDRPVVNKMTQEELLAEAAITEEINRDSLLEWQQMEAERKANAKKKDKRGIFGPFVRYHSFAENDGPIMRNKSEETTAPEITNAESQGNMDTETMTDTNVPDWKISKESDLMGRNLISFMNNTILMKAQQEYAECGTEADKDLENVDLIDQLGDWLKRPSKPNRPVICPITGEVARYKDPSTGIPYANITAYQVIKACLYHEMRWASTSGLYLGYIPSAKGVPEGWDAAI